MSASDWQPGDRALIEVEVEAGGPSTTLVAASGSEFVVDTADLLPVPQADEGAIERAAEVMWDATCADGMRATMRPDLIVMARALAAANLLASPVQPGVPDGLVDSARAWHEANGKQLCPDDWSDAAFEAGCIVSALATRQPGRSEAEIEWGVRYGDGEIYDGVDSQDAAEAIIQSHRDDISGGYIDAADYEPMAIVRREVIPAQHGPWTAARVADTTTTEGTD